MILFKRPYKKHLPLAMAEVLLPASGDRLPPAGLSPMLVKIWCGESKAAGLFGQWVDDLTVTSDLGDFPSLLPRLRSTLRREIKRAVEDDGLVRLDDWTPEQFIAFHREHDATNPNIPDADELARLRDAGRLSISAAVVNGEVLVAHANVEDFPRVRILKGYTRRKQADSAADYALVARANKALHYLDMAAYHEREFDEYDWGGFSGQPDNGIDKFKLQFLGGVRKQVHFRGVMPPGLRAIPL